MPACCVRNCTSRSTHPKTRRKNIRHFKFPRDSDIRRKWLNACQRYESELNMDYAMICEKHFETECLILKYVKRPKSGCVVLVPYLKEGSIPTLLLNLPKVSKQTVHNNKPKAKQSKVQEKTGSTHDTSTELLQYSRDKCMQSEATIKEEIIIEDLQPLDDMMQQEILGTTSAAENTPLINDPNSEDEVILTLSTSPTTSVDSIQFRILETQKTRQLNEAVGNFLIHEMLPCDIVERPSFKEMLQKFQPNYVVPEKETFIKTILPQLTYELEIKIKSLLSKTHFIALTIDCWVSVNLEPFIMVTAHFIDNVRWVMNRVCLSCRKLDVECTENLKQTLLDILEQWGIEKKIVSGCTSNNSGNIVECMQLLSWPHLSCFGHVLNSVINCTYHMSLLQEPIKKACIIRNTIAHSNQLKNDLESIQIRLELPQHVIPPVCETKWWSVLNLLKVIVEQHAALTTLFSETENDKYNNHHLSADELKALNTLIITIEPLEQICRHMCGEHFLTLSTIYPIYLTLNSKLNACNKILSDVESNDGEYLNIDYALSNEIKQNICQSLSETYGKPEVKTVIQIATFLDPRFKLNYFPEESTNLVSKIKEIMKLEPRVSHKRSSNLPTSVIQRENTFQGLAAILIPEQNARSKTFEEVVDSEIEYYTKSPTAEIDKDPLFWWSDHAAEFPNLSIMAEKYLVLQGTRASPEHVFNSVENTIDTRACLPPEHAEQIIFLSMNRNI